MKEASPIALLGNRERIRRQQVICVLSVLTVLPAWLGSTDFEQPLILAGLVSAAHGQQELPSSQLSTPFLDWYRTQGADKQVSNPLAVKITSPATGQQVPAGQSLIVSGVSSDNSTSQCKVSVIVNAEKPYQPAFPNGTAGINDYSTWNFMIRPTYTTIREGPDNKITSKLECAPNLTKWYSVNVTGIETTTTMDRAQAVTQPPLSFPVSPFASEDNNPDSNASVKSPNTSTFSTESVGRPTSPSLSISVNTPSSPVTIGEETIEATVIDSASHLQVDNAILELVLTDSMGNPIDESSDDDGDLSYTLDEAADGGSITPGKFTATLRASSEGYEPVSKTVSFDLGPLSGEESESNEDSNDNEADDSLFSEESDPDEDSSDNDIGEVFE